METAFAEAMSEAARRFVAEGFSPSFTLYDRSGGLIRARDRR